MTNISKPSARLVASFADRPPKFITFAKESARRNAIRIETFCRSVRCTIESVAWVLLFMVGLAVLSAITAAKEIWKNKLKGRFMARLARANKIDANQKDIVRDLRRAGYAVRVTSGMGDGFPDIIVGVGGRNFLFEIKDPEKPFADRQLTKDQRQFFDDWYGQCDVIHDAESAIQHIAIHRHYKG